MPPVDKLQKQIYKIVGPSLAASLEPLAHRQNVASLSLFYRYYLGRCSSELAQLVPLAFFQLRSTHYSDRLHHFSATIPRCYKCKQFLSSYSWTLEFSSELAQPVPLAFSQGRSTHYSDRLHDFSVTITRGYKNVYVNSLFPHTARLWNSLPIERFPLTYDLSIFKSRINRHLLTVGSF